MLKCPVCNNSFPESNIETHVDKCLRDAELKSDQDAADKVQGDQQTNNSDKNSMANCESFNLITHKSQFVSPGGKVGGMKNAENKKLWSFLKEAPGKNSSGSTVMEESSRSPGIRFFGKSSASGSTFQSVNAGRSKRTRLDMDGVNNPVTGSSFPDSGNKNKFTNESVTSKSAVLGLGNGSPTQNSSTGAKDSANGRSLQYSKCPLAERMRPRTLEEYSGQEDVVGEGSTLRRILEGGRFTSLILWGPPGCGKTSLARLIANQCKANISHGSSLGGGWRFVSLSATTSGIADVKECIKVARNEMSLSGRKTILFIDEIHRFNKLQQDAFLPHVEDGTIILIGATTENPSFHVNNALMSRCKVIGLSKLSIESVERILLRSAQTVGVEIIEDEVDCLSNKESMTRISEPSDCNKRIHMERSALRLIAARCDGDARSALNTLQMSLDVKSCGLEGGGGERDGSSGECLITVSDVLEVLGRTHVQYDRTGEEHYNCASALQKSIRGSDDNAALYWMTRMLEGGEDVLFIARRLVVIASEDIGLADNSALPLAVATFQACHLIGMPECRLNLAHCCTYLARAPKSRETTSAYEKIKQSIANHSGPQPAVPLHLRNVTPPGYQTKQNTSADFVSEVESKHYLPAELIGTDFYRSRKKISTKLGDITEN